MQNIAIFLRFLSPTYWKQFILFFILTLLNILFETLSLAMIIPLIDVLFFDSNNMNFEKIKFLIVNLKKIDFISYENLILIFLVGSFFLKNLFNVLYQIWVSMFVLRIEKFLASELFKNYLNRNMNFFLDTHSGTIYRNMTVEIKNVTKSLASFLTLVVEIFLVLTLVLFLLYLYPIATLSSAMILGMVGLTILFFGYNKIRRLSERKSYIDKKYNINLLDTLKSINDVKLHDKKNFFLNIHDALKNKYYFNSKSFSIINALPKQLLEFIFIVLVASYLFYSINIAQNAAAAISIISLFAVASLRLLPAISKIVISIQSLKFRHFSFKILLHELTDESKIYNDEILEDNSQYQKNKKIIFNDSITFKDVSFFYKKKKILNSLNFNIKKGNFFLIFGESGSGKTTILNLLMGLVKPDQGEVLVDNANINNNILSWRKMVSYVPQNIYLLDQNIKQNIAFGVEESEIDYIKLKDSMKLAKIENLALENNLDNFALGEEGSKISGGQIQRIGVARALYRNPNVILMDESTNGLDYDTEKRFLEDLIKIKKNTTIIFVSHREHIKKYADDILEVKKFFNN